MSWFKSKAKTVKAPDFVYSREQMMHLRRSENVPKSIALPAGLECIYSFEALIEIVGKELKYIVCTVVQSIRFDTAFAVTAALLALGHAARSVKRLTHDQSNVLSSGCRDLARDILLIPSISERIHRCGTPYLRALVEVHKELRRLEMVTQLVESRA
ncbi:hypothetical protein Y032_0588g357 [Ancylostoma ceylanicum]|uniref:Uncharacterized protein n=1 Tax=Ancylostoma ceylanicum TaxID=53326 RepID=A0A016WMW7_9BILA|nr:hypothetical protein Y032_0588g357 [Ancylostoma ceylanicum]